MVPAEFFSLLHMFLRPWSQIQGNEVTLLEMTESASPKKLNFTSLEQSEASAFETTQTHSQGHQGETENETALTQDPTPMPSQKPSPAQPRSSHGFDCPPLRIQLERCDQPSKLSKKDYLTTESIKAGLISYTDSTGTDGRSTGFVFSTNEVFEHDVEVDVSKMEYTVEAILQSRQRRSQERTSLIASLCSLLFLQNLIAMFCFTHEIWLFFFISKINKKWQPKSSKTFHT